MRSFFLCFFVLFCPLLWYGFGKNKVIYYSYDWEIAHSSHFELYIPRNYTNLREEVLSLLEEAYAHHKALFGHSVKKKVQVILYPNQIDFLKNNILPWTERGTEGFTELSRGRVALYYTPNRREMRHYVYHELAHVFQLSLWAGPQRGGIQLMSVPLWVVEGAAEWASVGTTLEGDRYVANLLYRGKLPTLKELGNVSRLAPYQYYLVYKMGALFYAFAQEKWGHGFFQKLFHTLAKKRNWEKVLQEDFGVSEDTLSREFRDFLSRRYFLLYPSDRTPQRINEKESFEAHIVWISSNEFITMGVDRYYPAYLLYVTNKGERKVLDKMGISEQSLYFQYQKNHLSKSTNGFVCWLIEGGDRYRLVVYDTKKKKKTLHALPYRVFFSPDISPSGEEVVVIAHEGKNHVLAVYNLRTKTTTVLVESQYIMESPRWFRENQILLVANFHHGKESRNMDLYLYDRTVKQFLWRMDTGQSDEMPFVYENREEKVILFVKQDTFPRLCLFHPEKEKALSLYTAPGEMSFPVLEGGELYFTLYDEGIMGLYRLPFDNEKEEYETLIVEKTPLLPEEKEIVGIEPILSKKYMVNFSFDTFLFLLSATSYGDIGLASIFAGSDTFGDHQLYGLVDSVFVGADPRIAGWNFEVGYFFLKYRHQIGLRVLHYNNPFYEWIQFPDFYQVEYRYFDKWQADLLYSYPFSTFQRFDGMISYRSINYPYVLANELFFSNAQDVTVYGAYIFDNTLESSIGPLDGLCFGFSVAHSLPFTGLGGFATRFLGDFRGYFMFIPGYGLATRVVAGTIFNYDTNRRPQQFFIGGHNSIRGYPYGVFRGDTTIVWNTEFRFPLIRYWQLGFPPIVLPTIWGVGFVDTGLAVDRERLSHFRGIGGDGKFQDIHVSLGWGLRLALGGSIKLMWNIAYPYDGTQLYGAVHEVVIAKDF